jgi:hypothetical protein
MMFLTCPARLDQDGAVRCGLPAEVRCRFTMRSTDGPPDSVMIRCPAGHHVSGPIESLTPGSADNHDPGTARASSRAGRDSRQRGHDCRDGGGGSALRGFLAASARKDRRPSPAAAYDARADAPAPARHRLRKEAEDTLDHKEASFGTRMLSWLWSVQMRRSGRSVAIA